MLLCVPFVVVQNSLVLLHYSGYSKSKDDWVPTTDLENLERVYNDPKKNCAFVSCLCPTRSKCAFKSKKVQTFPRAPAPASEKDRGESEKETVRERV